MLLGPLTHIRIARPSRDLRRTARFWVEAIGMSVLSEHDDQAEGGHPLLMLGWPGAAWHLELVGDPDTEPNPTEEDLLVLYAGGPVDDRFLHQVVLAGGRIVSPRNPYWARWGTTVIDPDGYLLVLSHDMWTPR
jgi:catechol 2,3-dioxygenase-like lactoylglutathione lyase family enzyme